MADLRTLPVVHQDEKTKQEVLDVLRAFVEMAERGELREVLVVGIDAEDGRLTLGASGQVGPTEQIGALERFKAAVIRNAEEA